MSGTENCCYGVLILTIDAVQGCLQSSEVCRLWVVGWRGDGEDVVIFAEVCKNDEGLTSLHMLSCFTATVQSSTCVS